MIGREKAKATSNTIDVTITAIMTNLTKITVTVVTLATISTTETKITIIVLSTMNVIMKKFNNSSNNRRNVVHVGEAPTRQTIYANNYPRQVNSVPPSK